MSNSFPAGFARAVLPSQVQCRAPPDLAAL
jgi:hypothetical protein